MKNIRADIGENYIFSRDSNSVSKIMIDAKKFKKI